MDTKKLLDGPVEDVRTRLADLSHDDLLKLREAEQADQNRADVLTAIEAAIDSADRARTGGTEKTLVGGTLTNTATAADLDTSGPADLPAATTFSPSGAPEQVVPDADAAHPALDANPRERTTEQMNRIDLNDPRRDGRDVVTEMLARGAKAD